MEDSMTKITVSRKKFKTIQKILGIAPISVSGSSVTFAVSKSKLLYLRDMGI